MKKNKQNDMMAIRLMMDDRYYHLHEEWTPLEVSENFGHYIETWKLYEKHDYWMTDNSKPIMTSETNTYEELYKFVKENRDIKEDKVLMKVNMIGCIICIILVPLNIAFFKDTQLRGFIYGVELSCIVASYIRFIINEKNFKFKMKRYDRRWKELKEEFHGEKDKTNDISKR